MHAREFLACFAGVPREAVSRLELPRGEAAAWLEAQRGLPGEPVLDCDENGRLFPATSIPNARQSAQNLPRSADTGVVSPTVRVLSIRLRDD
jgi:hypothetical protein